MVLPPLSQLASPQLTLFLISQTSCRTPSPLLTTFVCFILTLPIVSGGQSSHTISPWAQSLVLQKIGDYFLALTQFGIPTLIHFHVASHKRLL
eukprot:c1832_g2_i1 orf=1-276(-)